MEFTEDQIKEIAAKICHEKMKGLYDHVKLKVYIEIKHEIENGKIPLSAFIGEMERKRIENECVSHCMAICRQAFSKFMKCIQS